MTHQTHDIGDVHREQDFVQPYNLEDEDGNAKDLSGATIDVYVLADRRDDVHGGSESALVSKSDGGGVTITAAASGEFEVAFDSGDWADLPEQSHYYEIWVDDGSDQTKVVEGWIEADKPR